MRSTVNNLKLRVSHLDQRHVRLGLVILTLVLFVLGAGAPSSSGA